MTYDIVLMDPPWKYYGSGDKHAAAAKHYHCEPHEEIAQISPPLAKPGILFMWTTSAFMADAISLLEGWNLHYRGVAFVWVKTKADGTPIGAQGVRPSITKPLTEFVIAGSTEKKGRPLKLHSESVCQTIFAPRREHSRKPDETFERINLMYPNASKLEMYSRENRPGWQSWGNEVGKFDGWAD